MKKKILVIALVLVVAMSGVFAANNYKGASRNNTMGVGLNLGTNFGVGLKFGMGKFDIAANIGIDKFQFGNPTVIAGDVAVAYEVYDIVANRDWHFPVTVGGGLYTNITIGSESSFDIGAILPVGIQFTTPNVPINVYANIGPALGATIDGEGVRFDVDFYGNLGCLWVFDI